LRSLKYGSRFSPPIAIATSDNDATSISSPDLSKQLKPRNDFSYHQQWDAQGGWKSTLKNLRLIIQPTLLLWLIFPWLDIFPNRSLLLGLHNLIQIMNQFQVYFPDG
jgi:hypothetical protein